MIRILPEQTKCETQNWMFLLGNYVEENNNINVEIIEDKSKFINKNKVNVKSQNGQTELHQLFTPTNDQDDPNDLDDTKVQNKTHKTKNKKN